jgi:Fur family peroxide stress response transcriptional regulator
MTTLMRVNSDEVARRVAQFRATAKNAGIKLTAQRIEIFREVASSLEHPDAETVFRAVRTRMPTVSLDTVYRTLWMLKDLGLTSTLGSHHESIRFDANPKDHHHYVCVRCGLARDFEFESTEVHAVPLPDAVKDLGSILSTHIEIWGICKGCTKKPVQTIRSKTTVNPKDRKGKGHG